MLRELLWLVSASMASVLAVSSPASSPHTAYDSPASPLSRHYVAELLEPNVLQRRADEFCCATFWWEQAFSSHCSTLLETVKAADQDKH